MTHDQDHPTPPTDDQTAFDTLVDHLLGRLSDEESEALERRLLEEPRLLALAEAAETELADRRVRGELDDDDERRFDALAASTPRLADRLAFARALAHIAEREHSDDEDLMPVVELAERRAASSPTTARDPRATVARPLAWAALLVLVVLGGILGAQAVRQAERADALAASLEQTAQRVETERQRADRLASAVEATEAELQRLAERYEARLAEPRAEGAPRVGEGDDPGTDGELRRPPRRRRPESPPPPTAEQNPTIVSLWLAVATRSDRLPTVTLDETTDRAQLHLDLDGEEPRGELTVSVTRDRQTVWRQDRVTVQRQEPEGTFVALELPRQVLLEGPPYEVQLQAEDEGEEPRLVGVWAFRVEHDGDDGAAGAD